MIFGFLPAPQVPAELSETQENVNMLPENMRHNIGALEDDLRALDLLLTNEMSDPMDQDLRAIAEIQADIEARQGEVEQVRRTL